MKQIYTFFILFFLLNNFNGQTTFYGKTYSAEIGATCKDGIGMIYTSRILKFEKNTLKSYYKVFASVSPKRKKGYETMYDNLAKTYHWKIVKNVLIIENGEDIEKYKIENSKLIGFDNNWKKQITFLEQIK